MCTRYLFQHCWFGLGNPIRTPSRLKIQWVSICKLGFANSLSSFCLLFHPFPLLTVGMILFSGGCLYVTNLIENSIMAGIIGLDLWAISLIIFALAWVFQFIGHHIEGKKPSFLKDIQFLMIGPAWLMHFIYKKLHIPY